MLLLLCNKWPFRLPPSLPPLDSVNCERRLQTCINGRRSPPSNRRQEEREEAREVEKKGQEKDEDEQTKAKRRIWVN